MRKQITQSANVSNSAITNKMEESQMENLLKFYAKTFKRMSYRKDADTDKQRLDYMECLQEVIANYLQNKPVVENLKYYILRSAKNEMKDRYRKENRLDLTDENFEAEIFCFNLGEVIAAREAIQKLLTLTEYEVITLYGQGFTLEEIAVKIGLDHPEKVKRILFRSRGKVDSLKMEVMYDSKIAAYQGKQGKADIKYKDTIYNEKTDTYKEVKHIPSEVINRKFICLDQSKVKKQLLPENYSGDMCPCRKEVITEIASDTDSKKYEAKILNGQYMESNLGPFTSNKEVIQLYFNRHEYSQMLRSEMTVIKEKRYAIEFQTGRYISTDHKFKNLPA